MQLFLLFVIGVVFTAFVGLVFSVLTILLSKCTTAFEISGPDDWSFFDFYKRYLIVAAVYVFACLPLCGGLLGIPVLAVAYKYVFAAGWTQAAIMGTVGGFIARLLFALAVLAILAPLGLLQ